MPETKLTAGLKFAPQTRNLHDLKLIEKAKQERARLPQDRGDTTCLIVNKVTKNDSGSQTFLLTLRYNGREMVAEYTQGAAFMDQPAFADVLWCLMGDCSGVGELTFEEWCDEYGMNTDSRKALDTYHACVETLPKLKRLLGRDFSDISSHGDGLAAKFASAKTFAARTLGLN